jgi:hypothetical protein
VIDGEAGVLGVDGISDFNALHSGKHNEEVQLCAFDVLAMDGHDLRRLPLSMRKANLARLLRSRPEGMIVWRAWAYTRLPMSEEILTGVISIWAPWVSGTRRDGGRLHRTSRAVSRFTPTGVRPLSRA